LITNKRQKLQVTIVLIVGSFIAAHLCLWLLPNLFEIWDKKAIDRLFLLRSSTSHFQPQYDDIVVHVDISDSSLKRLKTFYLNRSHYARVVRNLTKMNVSAQMYDFIFAARSEQVEDDALIDATREAGNAYFGLAFKLSKRKDHRGSQFKRDSKDETYLERTEWDVIVDGNPDSLYEGIKPLMTFPELASLSRGLGYLNLKTDPDGVNRKIPLLVRYREAFYPSFAFRGICDFLNVAPGKIIIRPGKSITLKDAERPGEPSGHNIVIPIDQHGNMLINFTGPWGSMRHYNFADLFYASDDHDEMEMWRDELSGKIVIVSEATTGAADVGPVPTDADFISSGIHSNTIHTILQESFLREFSSRERFAIEIALLFIVLFLSLKFSSLNFSLGSIAITVSYVGMASASFLYGNLIFPIVPQLFTLALAVASIVVYRYVREERDRTFIRRTFGRYLTDEVVDELLDSPDGLKMNGETRDVTFLVSDLRGFTALSARMTPHEVIDILNRYLRQMIEIIARYRGTVDELQGDGILLFFGAPLSATDDPERAVACAIEMQNVMPGINREQKHLNLPELSMGIGINTGEVVVGNIGSERRSKYAAIGTPINTAYRIESYTVGGQILISPSTHQKIEPLVHIQDTIDVRFKGIDQPVTLYDVKGIKGTYDVSLRESPAEALRSLDSPLAITCHVLKGKTVSEKSIEGHLVRYGASGAEASLGAKVELHANLRIILGSLPEIYAKLTSIEQPVGASLNFMVRLAFTSLPEDTRNFLNKRLHSSP